MSEDADRGGGAPVARSAGESEVLAWGGQRGTGEGLAEGESGVLEEAEETGPSLTSGLRGESRCGGVG